MNNNSPHTVATLGERIEAQRQLMDERDRRYSDNRKCDQDAVDLAKEVADEAKGKVSTATIIGIVGVIIGTIGLILEILRAVVK